MEQQTGSKLGKEYVKAVYCHLGYLTYMQSIHTHTHTHNFFLIIFHYFPIYLHEVMGLDAMILVF